MKTLTLAVLLGCAGCATSSHKVTGNLHPELPPEAVKIFKTMPPHAQVIGTVSADSFAGMSLEQAQANAMAKLQTQAGRLGANGIVINATPDNPLSGATNSAQAIYVSP